MRRKHKRHVRSRPSFTPVPIVSPEPSITRGVGSGPTGPGGEIATEFIRYVNSPLVLDSRAKQRVLDFTGTARRLAGANAKIVYTVTGTYSNPNDTHFGEFSPLVNAVVDALRTGPGFKLGDTASNGGLIENLDIPDQLLINIVAIVGL